MTLKRLSSRRFWMAALVPVLIASFAIAVRAHDPKLDEADLALEKAEILLQAAEVGIGGKPQREFEKSVARAIQDIEEARAEVINAAAAADTP